MSQTIKAWFNSRHQMPPDMAPVWITDAPDRVVLSAVFYKGERIDPGAECFYWRIENRSNSTYEHYWWQHRESAPPPIQPTIEQKRMAAYKHTSTELPEYGDYIHIPFPYPHSVERLYIYAGKEAGLHVAVTQDTQVRVTSHHFYWRPGSLFDVKPEVRGSIHEANKARWVYSQFATPFEFNKPFWIYDEKLGVRLATLVRLVYGDEELPHQHGSPVFLDWETGAFLKGRRWYMDLLYPVKPS